jgi:hypothetical protein
MSKKRRTKKHNPKKLIRVVADGHLKRNQLAVWSTVSSDHAQVLSMKTKTVFDPDQFTAECITAHAHHWSYTLVVYCRDQNGQEYIVTGEPELPDADGINLADRRLKQSDLAVSLNQAHQDFIKESINPLHISNTGWIAFPYKAEISEEDICKIADSLGIWKYKTRWEVQAKAAVKERQDTVKAINQSKTKTFTELGK